MKNGVDFLHRCDGVLAADTEHELFAEQRGKRLVHPPGRAVGVSPYEQSVLADKIMRLADEVPDEAPVVVYCTASEDCEDSAMISRQLQAGGFQNITIYKGGFPEWEAKLRNDERKSKLITKGAEPGERDL